MKIIIITFILLLSTIASADDDCARLFANYIQKRQEYKLSLVAFTLNADVSAIRLERQGPLVKTFRGGFKGIRVYNHRTGTRYLSERYTGDELFTDGPFWAPGPLKIFISQDEDSNGPLTSREPDQISRINLKTYKALNCRMDYVDPDSGAKLYRFEVAPRLETAGTWYGYIDADPETLLTIAETSTRTILSDRARSNWGGRMKEFDFTRKFQIVDGRASIPIVFKTHAKSQWSQYSEVLIEARFELVDYKVGDR